MPAFTTMKPKAKALTREGVALALDDLASAAEQRDFTRVRAIADEIDEHFVTGSHTLHTETKRLQSLVGSLSAIWHGLRDGNDERVIRAANKARDDWSRR
jgi:hypothetical protein